MRLSRTLLALLLILFVIVPSVAHAKIAFKTVEGRGSGANPKNAIYDALINALGQVNGMQMASQELATLSSVKVDANVNGNRAKAEFNSSEYQQQIAAATKGIIREYQVVSLDPDPYNPGLVQAIVKATVAQYKRSQQANRNRIAVLPFRIANPNDNVQRTFAQQFAQGLTSYLTQTRKFAVLDRDFTDESDSELNSLKSPDVPVEEMARLGNKLGADFIIVGQINKAVAKSWYKEMKTTGKKFPMSRYGAALTYRVLDVATGQILSSQLYDGIKNHQGGLPDMGAIAKKDAEKIGHTIVEGIFPLVVVSVSGDSLYLGQGGETITRGQKFTLIQYGKRIVDPYTKESLGREEHKVGVVQVEAIQAKTSRAKILSCDVDIANSFAPNTFIVRPIKETPRAVKAAQKTKQVQKALDQSLDDMEEDMDDDW